MWNSFDPDQARRFVGPNLGLNCLQRVSADHIGWNLKTIEIWDIKLLLYKKLSKGNLTIGGGGINFMSSGDMPVFWKNEKRSDIER